MSSPARFRLRRTVYGLGAVVLGVWALGGSGCRRSHAPTPPQATINGYTWTVELAVTPLERYTGLAGRASLAADRGMLFIFPDSAIREFCMRGCHIPLDVAFINAEGRVVHTATMAVEPDHAGEVIYSSQVPAKYVLEVPAGGLAAAAVTVGDPVVFSSLIPR